MSTIKRYRNPTPKALSNNSSRARPATIALNRKVFCLRGIGAIVRFQLTFSISHLSFANGSARRDDSMANEKWKMKNGWNADAEGSIRSRETRLSSRNRRARSDKRDGLYSSR